MFQHAIKSNAETGKQQNNKKRLVRVQKPVIQRCGTSKVKKFFYDLKTDNSPEKNLNVYSHVYSDGLGDAGQLKLLYDKVDKVKNKLRLSSLEMLCTYDISDQVERWKSEHNGEDCPPEEKLNIRSYIENRIKKVCGVKDEKLIYTNVKEGFREQSFGDMSENDWEVEYPAPDPAFKSDHLLKIKEMGAADDKIGIKAGDALFGGIGYGVPDEFKRLTETDPKSAESFLKTKTKENNVEALLNKAWIVSVKNYIFKSGYGDKYASFPEERMNNIAANAKAYGAKLIIFAGMPKMNGNEYQKQGMLWWKIHIICSDIEHDTLRDLMTKITDGVIISGGEGLFAESLSTPDQKTASVLAARYGFQYQETAFCLLSSDNDSYKISSKDQDTDYEKQLSLAMKGFRIFFINNNFYYAENENNFIEILEKSIENTPTPKEELQGKELLFSKNLSALWLPLSINSNLRIQRPTVFSGLEDTLEVFKSQKQRLANNSWFALIDNAVEENSQL